MIRVHFQVGSNWIESIIRISKFEEQLARVDLRNSPERLYFMFGLDQTDILIGSNVFGLARSWLAQVRVDERVARIV